MYLGIDPQTGLIYEGSGNPDLPALPLPTVTQAKLIEKPEDWNSLPGGLASDPFKWVFREDSFDTSTRIRRGRLYQSYGGSQPSTHHVARHPYDPTSSSSNVGIRIQKSLNAYMSCYELLNMPRKGLGLTLALGGGLGASGWRIIQAEMLASRAVMVTLKSLSSYDILPEIDAAKIAEAYRPQVAQAMERVLDSAFRESPISVIDHCRDALAVVLARWMTQNGGDPKALSDDLAKLAGAVEKAPHDKVCAGNMGRVVALLHNRGKTNQQISNGWRAPVEEDAAMAVQALGFTLRELGWAKDTSFPAHP
ncbi:MAG: hypothetical protein Q7T44_17545 [Parvibaculum sp.]|nr:hypothetical protein [Parvibaculum sp.]